MEQPSVTLMRACSAESSGSSTQTSAELCRPIRKLPWTGSSYVLNTPGPRTSKNGLPLVPGSSV